MQALAPSEVLKKKADLKLEKALQIPNFMIEIFNAEIAKNFNESSKDSVVEQDAIAMLARAHIAKNKDHLGDVDPYQKGWLDVEPIFEHAGWDVVYRKQPYYETASSFFIFTKKEN